MGPVLNCYLLLAGVNDERSHYAVDFGFAGISDTVSDVSMAVSINVCDREERVQTFTLLDFNTPLSSCFTKTFHSIGSLCDNYKIKSIPNINQDMND